MSSTEQVNHTARLDSVTRTVTSGRRDGADTKTVTVSQSYPVGIGWDSMLLGLTLHLSSGAGMDREEAAAWVASDDGRAFMRRSGEAWCRAQIDAGEDEDAARAAADRCIAAYLG